MRTWIVHLCILVSLSPFADAAAEEKFPARHMKMVVTSGPGTGPDIVARNIAEPLGRGLGQQFVLVNQPGAGGAIGMRDVLRAIPDGYTWLFAGGSAFTTPPDLQANTGYNVGDFIPVGYIGEQPFAIAVDAKLNINSLSELIAYSKAQSGGINCATGMRGGLPHLAAEAFRQSSGADLSMVYYAGGAQAIQDVVAGRVPVIIAGLGSLVGQAEAAAIKLLAISSHSRLPDFPDLPTVSESVPDFYAVGWYILAAPPKTPETIVSLVREQLDNVLSDQSVQKRLKETYTYARTMTPEKLDAFIRHEQSFWGALSKRIKAER